MEQEMTIRVHLWVETREGVAFGMGRLLLLDFIEQYGSLRKAASAMGMSYRAAWCKLRTSEKALGLTLVEPVGSKREGCRLTPEGVRLRESFRAWFRTVERTAQLNAQAFFAWPTRAYPSAETPAEVAMIGDAAPMPPPVRRMLPATAL